MNLAAAGIIILTLAHAALAESWPLHALQRSPACASIHNELLCARAIEAQQLTNHRDVARRIGDTLVLELTDQRQLAFGDSLWMADPDGMPAAWQSTRHSFLGYFRPIDAVLIHLIAQEDRQLLLIDRASGEETPLEGVPLFSPSHERFLVATDFILHENYLQIWRARDRTVEFDFHSYEWRFPTANWVGEETISVTGTATANSADFLSGTDQLQLTRSATSWSLTEVIPARVLNSDLPSP